MDQQKGGEPYGQGVKVYRFEIGGNLWVRFSLKISKKLHLYL